MAKLATKASKLRFVSKAGKAVAYGKAAIRGTATVVEISSGGFNAAIKILDKRDDPTKTNNSFGLPEEYFEELLDNIATPQIIKN